jgi:hypothetical protein
MAINPNIIDEKDLPKNLQTIERAPVVAGGSPPGVQNFDSFSSGSVNSVLGLPTDLAASQIPGSLPTFRLQPTPASGSATGNAASQSNLLKNPQFVQSVSQTQANTTAISQATNPAGYVIGLSTARAVNKNSDNTLSEIVSLTFTPPAANPNLGNFQAIAIYATNYQGSAQPTLVGQGITSPVSFKMSITGETVVLTVQSISSTGIYSAFSGAPTTSVVLNGVTTAPSAPTISTTLAATPTGYQFSFNYEGGLLADVIQGYNIYRNTSNTTSGASLIKNVSQPAQSSGVYTYQETVPNGTFYYYFVSAVNTTGLESLKTSAQSGQIIGGFVPPLTGTDGVSSTSTGHNIVFNGDFSIATVPTGVQSATASAIRVQDLQNGGGIQPSCNGWTRNFETGGNGEGVIYQFVNVASSGLVGPFAMVLQDRTSSTGDLFAAVSDAFSVRQNIPYTFSANINPGYGGGGGIPTHAAWYFRVLWYKVGATDLSRSSADLISFADIVSASTASGFQAPSGTLTSPANAGYCRIAFYHYYDGVTVPTSGWNLAVSNVRCFSPVDPSNLGQVLATGSTPSSLSGGFTYTSTTTSVTISWSGLTIYRADGSTTAVTNGGITVTGLSASTTYRVYPYWDEALAALNFVNPGSGGPTGAGSPAMCYTAGSNPLSQNQNLQTRIPLSASSGVIVTTPASGGGGGSGGGSGSCLHEAMVVETPRGIIQIIDAEIGDQVFGEHEWQTVTYKKVRAAEIFICIQLTDGSEILCTPTHPFTMPEGSEQPMKRAQDLSLADFLITKSGVGAIKSIEVVETKARKVTLTVEPSYSFFAGRVAPTILTHNFLPS